MFLFLGGQGHLDTCCIFGEQAHLDISCIFGGQVHLDICCFLGGRHIWIFVLFLQSIIILEEIFKACLKFS